MTTYRAEGEYLRCTACDQLMDSIENADICTTCGLAVGNCIDCAQYTENVLCWTEADAPDERGWNSPP